MLIRLTYRSNALSPRGMGEQLDFILNSARIHNARDGITGALAATPYSFVHVLEGARREVEATFARIRRDTRHCDIVLLDSVVTPQRRYADPELAFVDIGEIGLELTEFSVSAAMLIEPEHADFDLLFA